MLKVQASANWSALKRFRSKKLRELRGVVAIDTKKARPIVWVALNFILQTVNYAYARVDQGSVCATGSRLA